MIEQKKWEVGDTFELFSFISALHPDPIFFGMVSFSSRLGKVLFMGFVMTGLNYISMCFLFLPVGVLNIGICLLNLSSLPIKSLSLI